MPIHCKMVPTGTLRPSGWTSNAHPWGHASIDDEAEPTMAQMLVMQDCNASLTTQMKIIHIDFSLLKQDVQNLRESTGVAEDCILKRNPPTFFLPQYVQPKMKWWPSKLNDFLENCSHRNNLCLVGFLEYSKVNRIHCYRMCRPPPVRSDTMAICSLPL